MFETLPTLSELTLPDTIDAGTIGVRIRKRRIEKCEARFYTQVDIATDENREASQRSLARHKAAEWGIIIMAMRNA